MLQFIQLRGFLFVLHLFTYVGSIVSPGFKYCETFFYKNKPPIITATPEAIDICQHFPNKHVFYFATKYYINYRIPLYSAYVLSKKSFKNKYHRKDIPGTWRTNRKITTYLTSPDLFNVRNSPNQNIDSNYQAEGKDYDNSGWHRGHLNPVFHNRDSKERMEATFTLTNAAPQAGPFNHPIWFKQVEEKVFNLLKKHCYYEGAKRFIITGTIPGRRWLKEDRVNIPSHYWTAVCCDTSVTGDENKNKGWSIGAYGVNLATTKNVNKISIKNLTNFLKQQIPNSSRNVVLFRDDNCEFDAGRPQIIMNEFNN